MAKKITSITINNFRAYYGQYDKIDLSQGQNILIYGENGSGKSSLYKAVANYFRNASAAVPFSVNRYHAVNDGDIKIQFSDFDDTTNQLIPSTEVEYFYGSAGFNNQVPFIQAAALVNGFLDYTDLLKVYLHDQANPNLFELIVLSLLGNHIPISSGGTHGFGPRWEQMQKDLKNRATKRTDWVHRLAIANLPIFEIQLKQTLDETFTQLNRLLGSYFSDLNIELSYNLQPLSFNYGRKWQWYTTADLRLNVYKDGILIAGDYNDFLNEARLSAIAICLYLASLLVNPTGLDVKILYLDDIFIGLDAGNRIPILNILRQEFSAYQKFISTYDRHWFELAKKQFDTNEAHLWSTMEIYVGSENVSGRTINKPILIKGESNVERAIKYLHHRTAPDYPAAANYFRKALEELLTNALPGYELTDLEFTQYPGYKLSTVLNRARKFLEKTGNDSVEVRRIIGLLHNLLHPLSHYEISSPIYKNELTVIEEAYYRLKGQLSSLNIPNSFKCCLEAGKLLKITFLDSVSNYYSYYEILLKESLIIIRDSAGSLSLSECDCVVDSCYGNDNGTLIRRYEPRKNDPAFQFTSVLTALRNLHSFLVTRTAHPFPLAADYISQIEFKDQNLIWQPLSGRITWS